MKGVNNAKLTCESIEDADGLDCCIFVEKQGLTAVIRIETDASDVILIDLDKDQLIKLRQLIG